MHRSDGRLRGLSAERRPRTLAIWLAENWPSGRRGPGAGYHNRVRLGQLGEAWRSRGLQMTGDGFGRQAVRLCRDGGDSPGGPARVL